MAVIQIKRVYESVATTDGFRVLVDRLWPRGMTTAAVHADDWKKELAPSPSLRIWFKHHPGEWESFSHSYCIELKLYCKADALRAFCKAHKKITLLYASKDETNNHAVLLQQYLQGLQKRVHPEYRY